MYDNEHKTSYFAGPLNLNRETRQADTVLGTELVLDANAFDVLDILASQEGESFTFEQLFETVWENPDTGDREAALIILNNLIGQISFAGKGFMWIDHKPDNGYTFRTKWGHNKQMWQCPENPMYISYGQKPLPPIPIQRKQKNRPVATLVTLVGIAAALLGLVIAPMLYASLTSDAAIDDPQIPFSDFFTDDKLPEDTGEDDTQDDDDDDDDDEDDDGEDDDEDEEDDEGEESPGDDEG